ncbi:MAG: DUF998 domain-containing protein [Propionibacteriaceae bacterium]|nr:DUF998 domain-containing protein [Propionibacteriaceae bacterium]
MNTTPPRDGRNMEDLSLLLGGLGFGVGAVLGLLLLNPPAPLFGKGSVGEMAALAGGAVAGVAFLVVMLVLGPTRMSWQRRLSRFRRVVDLAGLTLVHALISMLTIAAAFVVFSDAFQYLALDQWAGGFLTGGACAVAAYVAASSANNLTTQSLSLLVATFLVVGAFTSALTSSDPQWWQAHFSALGAASDASGITFNFTLILTGVVLTALADFLTHDLTRWAEHTGEPRWKVVFVRTSFIILGIMLGMVGVIPVNQSLFWHNMVTYVAIGAFVVMLLAVPFLFRRLSGGFVGVTIVVAAMMAVGGWLNLGIGYLNITAFEIAAVGTVFIWLILFTRSVSAAVADIPEAIDAPVAPELEPA